VVSATDPHGRILDFLDRKDNYTRRFKYVYVESEVLLAVVANVTSFWDVTPYNQYVNRGTYHIHLRGLSSRTNYASSGSKISQGRNQPAAGG
jgi:hypothetical protein